MVDNLMQASPDFRELRCHHIAWQALHTTLSADTGLTTAILRPYQNTWQALPQNPDDDTAHTDWLIHLFNDLFADSNTRLVRGADEPEYFAASHTAPAQICFAHGYFASALHEISHWCIAGKKRRQLDDFGYWYCPDGRDKLTQAQFEQVEIRPQAIECLLTHATNRPFYVSADNLNASFDTSQSTFAHDVYIQARQFLHKPTSLPKDAKRLLLALYVLCQDKPLAS